MAIFKKTDTTDYNAIASEVQSAFGSTNEEEEIRKIIEKYPNVFTSEKAPKAFTNAFKKSEEGDAAWDMVRAVVNKPTDGSTGGSADGGKPVPRLSKNGVDYSDMEKADKDPNASLEDWFDWIGDDYSKPSRESIKKLYSSPWYRKGNVRTYNLVNGWMSNNEVEAGKIKDEVAKEKGISKSEMPTIGDPIGGSTGVSSDKGSDKTSTGSPSGSSGSALDPLGDAEKVKNASMAKSAEAWDKTRDEFKNNTGVDIATGETNGYTNLVKEGKKLYNTQKNLTNVTQNNPNVKAVNGDIVSLNKTNDMINNAINKAKGLKDAYAQKEADAKNKLESDQKSLGQQKTDYINNVRDTDLQEINNIDTEIDSIMEQLTDGDNPELRARMAELRELRKSANTKLEEDEKLLSQLNLNSEDLDLAGYGDLNNIIAAQSAAPDEFNAQMKQIGIDLQNDADTLVQSVSEDLTSMQPAIEQSNNPELKDFYSKMIEYTSNFDALTGKTGQLSEDQANMFSSGLASMEEELKRLYDSEEDIAQARNIRDDQLNKFLFYAYDSFKTALFMYVSVELKNPQLAYSAIQQRNRSLSEAETKYKTDILGSASKANNAKITGTADADYQRELNQAQLERIIAEIEAQGLKDKISVDALYDKFNEFEKISGSKPDFATWYTLNASEGDSVVGLIKGLLSGAALNWNSLKNSFGKVFESHADGGIVGDNNMGNPNPTGQSVTGAEQKKLLNIINTSGKVDGILNNALKTSGQNVQTNESSPLRAIDKQNTWNMAMQSRQPLQMPQGGQPKQDQKTGWNSVNH